MAEETRIIMCSEISYGVGNWSQKGLGNHRAIVRVSDAADAVRTRIPWRRRDRDCAEKAVVVIDASTGDIIRDIHCLQITREVGDIVFRPSTAPGEYHIYYMPYDLTGDCWCPVTEYKRPASYVDAAWLTAIGNIDELAQAELIEIQARTEFDRFYPMELIATEQEVSSLLHRHSDDYLVFTEDREFPVRMTDDLPLRWIKSRPNSVFRGIAQRDEFYVFQIGVFAARRPLHDIKIDFEDMTGVTFTIPASAFQCFNTGGVDWLGKKFDKSISIGNGKVGALWIGVQIPRDASPGTYRGRVNVRPQGLKETTLEIELTVDETVISDHGDNDIRRLSRLRWLDSTIGVDDEVTAPYTPLVLDENSVKCLLRSVEFGPTGLPSNIRSKENEILAAPIELKVFSSGKILKWSCSKPTFKRIGPGAVEVTSQNCSEQFTLTTHARMEFDGYINFRLTLRAESPVSLDDVSLIVPIRREIAKYMMGLGRKGGFRPSKCDWRWDITLSNSSVWIGDVSAGLHMRLKDDKDSWELYSFKDIGLPESWANDGKGGVSLREEGDAFVINAFSGPRDMRSSQEIEFRFGLLITPLKELDQNHWDRRYYHAIEDIESLIPDALYSGSTCINIHQGRNPLNPYINYPFLKDDLLEKYVDEVHANGMNSLLYYTVRELSNYAVELWAFRSLDGEIYRRKGSSFAIADHFVKDRGEKARPGYSWLREHLVDDFISAWHERLLDGEWDAAIATTGLSRLHNFYLEGLAWLLSRGRADGLYLDGIGYNREVMKRVRKVLDRVRPGSVIDFHSGNNFFPAYGLSSPANQYMEHFPYIDSLWLGEGYDYNESPDYWLVEISGIPFGLYSEMLQDGGNPWRGMLYGMTNRRAWQGWEKSIDPKHIWKLWDDFGIQQSKMLGYWDADCPVSTDCKDVLATAYVRDDRTMIALASWSPKTIALTLTIDCEATGIDPLSARLHAPFIADGFQDAADFELQDKIDIEPGKGLILILSDGR